MLKRREFFKLGLTGAALSCLSPAARKRPADSKILMDPSRLGWDPNRLLTDFVQEAGGDGIAYFDNVRAVYTNRIR